ncbi:hypothetical protein M758_8G195400 [Ceratodon purpureus]|nr:hypothetical protein M758_8G195400 [Ceratodon purpureus]
MDKIRRRTGPDHFFDVDPDDDADVPRPKKARFPKGKKESSAREFLRDPVDGEEGGGPILSTDPRLAAKERAMQRTVLHEQLISSEDVALVEDVVAAEEEGDMLRLEDGITIEPFNLNQEREEGYFDAEGNYVEYRLNDDDKDAWFETAKVDESLQAKKKKEREMAKEDTELTKEERWVIQKRIADTLQPGETILQAFRRLRGLTKDKNETKDRKRPPRMTGETKEIFDRLTEDAMKLLDNGDYNIYHEEKETLQREADGYEALARARRGETSGSAGHTIGGAGGTILHPQSAAEDDGSFDMFGGDDDIPSSTTIGGTSVNMHSLAEQTSNTVPELPGYIYDAHSGYYYNADDGYFYDKNTGLFCNASSGKWFIYDGTNASYLVVSESGDTSGVTSSV